MKIAVFLALCVVLLSGTRIWADAPRICYVTSGGGTSVVVGDGFDSTAKVLVWNTKLGQKDLSKYAGSLKGPVSLPATPPAGAREISPINVTNDQVLNVVLPEESTVLWVRTAAGMSPPRLVNAPQIYLVTDEQPLPGEQMRLFGRNFCVSGNESTDSPDLVVMFRRRSTGQATIAKIASLSEQYWEHTDDHVIGIIVPEHLKPGPYDILVHAAYSGAFGWSAPYEVDVAGRRSLWEAFSRPDQASRDLAFSTMPVKGAAGDGLHDDTQAIQSALDQSASAGGGVVLLPAGQYAITKTLRIPPGVFLRGAGAGATSIVVSQTMPMHGGLPDVVMTPSLSWQRGYSGDWMPYMTDMTPMIWMQTKSGVSDMSLIGGPGARCAIFVATPDWRSISQDVSIVRMDISTSQRTFDDSGRGASFVFGISVGTATRSFTIFGCHFKCCNPLYILPARPESYGATITDNTFEIYPRQSSGAGGLSSLSYSVIEDNDFIGGSRALTFSRGFNHCWIFNNRITDDGAWANAEEMLMSEYSASLWGGACQSATANTIQAAGAQWSPGQFTECSDQIFVFIKLGKGFGQIRRVTANTADALTVDTPWDIVPDSTTRFSVLPFTYRNLYINDQAIDCNGRCEFGFGSMAECVISGLNTRDCEGASSTSCDCGVICYNDYSYNRLIGLSGIHLQGEASYDTGIMTIPGVDVGENRRGNVIGNTIRYNEVMDFRQYALNQYDNWWSWMRPLPTEEAGISVSDGSFNVVDDNYVTKGAVGIRIDRGDGNVIRRNRVDDVATPIIDRGRETFIGAAGH